MHLSSLQKLKEGAYYGGGGGDTCFSRGVLTQENPDIQIAFLMSPFQSPHVGSWGAPGPRILPSLLQPFIAGAVGEDSCEG